MAALALDVATAETILKLQLQDVDDALEEAYEELTEDESTAFKMMREDIGTALKETEDRRIATVLGRVGCIDREVLENAYEDEQQAVQDHDFTCRLAGILVDPEHRAASAHFLSETASVLSAMNACQVKDDEGPETAPFVARRAYSDDSAEDSRVETQVENQEEIEEAIEDLAAKEVEEMAERVGGDMAAGEVEEEVEEEKLEETAKVKIRVTFEVKAEDSTHKFEEMIRKGIRKEISEVVEEAVREGIKLGCEATIKFRIEGEITDTKATVCYACAACTKVKPKVDYVLLGYQPEPHAYCSECLINLFKTSICDTTLFPPRCCRETIPLDAAKPFLTNDPIKAFEEKSLELSTPNPIYSSNLGCSHFIPPNHVEDGAAVCSACATRTCTNCRKGAHDGICLEESNVQELLRIARDKRWQRCYNCHIMVELADGCHHMTYVPCMPIIGFACVGTKPG